MLNTRVLTFGGVALDPGGDWEEITAELDGPNVPWTVARSNGIGVLQFSIALCQDGPIPNPNREDLVEMLNRFAFAHALQGGFDETWWDEGTRIVGRSFRQQDIYIRVWYVSDGRNFALVTYNCDWDLRQSEVDECERMLRTLRFVEV